MKLSEQYARKINKLDEFNEVPIKTTGGGTNDATGLTWLATDALQKVADIDTQFPWAKYAAGIFLVGKYRAPIYRAIFKPGITSMKDWYKRFKNIKNLRELDIPPHVSESAWRHFLNVIFQKNTHTLTDIENKVKAGQFTLNQATKMADEIMPTISTSQRYQLHDKLAKLVPGATHTSLGTQLTKGATTGKIGGMIKNTLTDDQFNSLTKPQRAAYGKNSNLTYDELKLIGTPAGKKAEEDALKKKMADLGLSTPTGL